MNTSSCRRAALWKLEQSLDALGIDRGTATLHVAQGVPYQVINSTARRLDIGLIVMGSVGRSGVSGLPTATRPKRSCTPPIGRCLS